MTELPRGLASWVSLPGPILVLTAIRERAERGHRIDVGTLRVRLTEQQRREVGRLLGTRWEVSANGLACARSRPRWLNTGSQQGKC